MSLVALKPSQELVDIVGALGGVWHGHVATCRCPAHQDRTPSLSLRQGHRAILVTCFAGCAAKDVLRELSCVPRLQRFVPPSGRPLGAMRSVERLWSESRPIKDTLAERYLRCRFLEPGPDDLRFHPACPLGPARRVVFRPALLVGIRDGRRLVAVQRVFLNPATGRRTLKATLGRAGEGAWRGHPVTGDTLAIAEGFETAAAFTMLHGVPCWASLGARRLDRMHLPPAITTLLIAQDNDLEGEAAALRAQARYTTPDRAVRLMPPPGGANDWAEVLEHQGKRRGGSKG